MKESLIDYFNILQASIEYIEKNIKTKISLDALSMQACFSKFHYDRIFRALVGESPIDYVRRRRLSLAADELIKTDKKIVDIGMEYAFGSPEAFTRTFKRAYGITPGEYRELQNPFILHEKADLIKNKTNKFSFGRFEEAQIITRDKFNVIGMECLIDAEDDEKHENIQKLWDIFISEKAKLEGRVINDTMFGICMDSSFPGKFSYTACMEIYSVEDIPLGMSVKTIPASDYAVFTHKGPLSRLSDTYDMIYGIWLPFSNYSLFSGIDDIEVYDSRFTLDEKCEIDIYIPIK